MLPPLKFVKAPDDKSSKYVLIYVDTAKLDHEWSRDDGFYIPPGGPSAISSRRERFQKWMEDNPDTPIEAPSVGWNSYRNCVGFTNGRHRFSVLRDLGYPSVAVTIARENLKDFKPMMVMNKAAAASDTPAFKTWFGNSQIVDEQGKPLRVFHGTGADFSSFELQPKKDKKWVPHYLDFGFHFTADTTLANTYAELANAETEDRYSYSSGLKPGSPMVYPVYLKADNLLDLDAPVPGVLTMALEEKIQNSKMLSNYKINHLNGLDSLTVASQIIGLKGVEAAIRGCGYNGVHYTWQGHSCYIVFSPNQIKSAIGNSGEFSPNDSRIVASAPVQFIWAEYPVNSGKVITEESNKLHANWFAEIGIPSRGPVFDRIARGIAQIDSRKKLVTTSSYNPKWAPNCVWKHFKDEFPGYEITEEDYDTFAYDDARFQFQAAAIPYGEIRNILTEMMKDVEPGLPLPELKIVNNTLPRWLGRCSWTYGDPTTLIELQKATCHDEHSLRRILAHELAHHEAFMGHFAKMDARTYRTMWRIEEGHGKTWQDIVARWNAKYGANFITETSDENNVVVHDEKEFYVLLWNAPQGIRWQSSMNISVQAVKAMWTAASRNTPEEMAKYKLVKTSDRDLLSKLNIGERAFGYSTNPETMKKAAELFKTGTNLWEQEVTARATAPTKPIAKFFVLIGKQKYGSGEFIWQQSTTTPNEKQKEQLGLYARMTADGTSEYKLVVSTNLFLKAGSRLGGYHWSFPRSEDDSKALAEAWESPDLLPKYVGVRKSFFSSLLQPKAAAPISEGMKSQIYFHGTGSEASAQAILKDGIQPREITMPDKAKSRSQLAPVSDRVYLTTDRSYAAIYALGGQMFGSVKEGDPIPKWLENRLAEGKYGYIFEIHGSQLSGDVVPDEDSIGDALHWLMEDIKDNQRLYELNNGKPERWKGELDSLKRGMEIVSQQRINQSDVPRQVRTELQHLYTYYLTDRQKQNLTEIGTQAQVGKKLQKHLSQSTCQWMLENGSHVAHRGAIFPTHCWRFSKEKALYTKNLNDILEEFPLPNKTAATMVPSAKPVSTLPTFEEFLEFCANGKPNVIDRLWGEVGTEDPYDKGPDEETKKQQLTAKFNKAIAKLRKVTFPARVYRKMRLQTPEKLRTREVGLSWSTSERKAQVIFGDLALGKDFLYSGEIDADAVSWNETIYWRMSSVGNDEDELRLIKGAPIRNLMIKSKGSWQPVGQGVPIAASHKQTPFSDTVFPNTEADNASEIDPGEGTNGYANQPERVEGDILAPPLEAMISKQGDLEGDGQSSFFEEVENPHSVQPLRAPDDANGDTMFPNKIGNIAKGASEDDGAEMGVPKKSYGLVMIELPEGVSELFSVNDDDLMGDGIEEESHITVRYGIEPDSDLDAIKALLEKTKPFTITFGKTGSFPPSKSSDGAAPVIVHIESEELHKINADLASVGSWKKSDFPDYKPHMTLAYVKPGTEDKYSGLDTLEGQEHEVTELVISDSNETHHVIKLGVKTAAAIAVSYSHGSLPTWQEFVASEGGFKKLLYSMGDAESHYSEWLSMENPDEEPDDEDVLRYAEADLRNRFEDVVSNHEFRTFPMEVYREVSLKDISSLRLKNVGDCWSWDENKAEAHNGNFGAGMEQFVLRAQIKATDVDWAMTLYLNIDPSLGEEEAEIRLHAGARIKLTGWKKRRERVWQKPLPTWKNVTAAATGMFGKWWVTPEGKFVRAKGAKGGEFEGRDIHDGELFGFKDKGKFMTEGYISAEQAAITAGYTRVIIEPGMAYLQFGDKSHAERMAGGIVRQIPVTVPRVEVEWDTPSHGYYRYSLADAEERFQNSGMVTAGAGDMNAVIPRLHTETPALHSDPVDEATTDQEAWDAALPTHRVGAKKTSDELLFLKDYLTMADEQKGEEVARTFTETFVDWLEENEIEIPKPAKRQAVIRELPTKLPKGENGWEVIKADGKMVTLNGGTVPAGTLALKNGYGKIVATGKDEAEILNNWRDVVANSYKAGDAERAQYDEDIFEALREHDDHAWDAVPKDLFVQFMDAKEEYLMQNDPAECPSFMHMSFEKMLPNGWLIHKTDDPARVCAKGFTIGMHDLSRLGLTTYYKESGKMGGYNFAFTAADARHAEEKYGRHAVIFQAAGVEVYHYGDSERQVIFKGADAHNLIPVYESYGEWVLSEGELDEPVFQAGSLQEIVAWIQTNYSKYRKTIVKRASFDDDDIAEAHFDDESTVAGGILDEYKRHKNDPNYRMEWDLVPAPRLIKIWNDYMKTGFVRDEKGIDMIAGIILTNIAKLNVNTILCGHDQQDPLDYAENIMGERPPDGYFDNDAFFEDEKGSLRISDYALKPLSNLEFQLRKATKAELKLQTIDRILNIIHARSDLAGWFVQGGQATLNRLAGTGDSLEPKIKPKETNPLLKKKAPAK